MGPKCVQGLPIAPEVLQMKRVVFALALTCFVGLSVFAQTRGRTRAATPKEKPKVQNDTATPKQAPSLGSSTYIPPPPPPPSAKKKEEDEVILVETDLVTTPVSVMDRNGRFIAGLKKKDFKIFENGIPQEVTYFQSEETPF